MRRRKRAYTYKTAPIIRITQRERCTIQQQTLETGHDATYSANNDLLTTYTTLMKSTSSAGLEMGMANAQAIEYPLENISTHTHLIRDGIRLTIQRGTGGTQIRYDASEQSMHTIDIGFNLGGPIRSILSANQISQTEQSEHGQAHIAFYPGCSGVTAYRENHPVCYLGFMLSVDLYERFFDTRISDIKRQMRNQRKASHILFRPITADMKIALHQMMLCSFLGKTRELFFEGKILELISHLRQYTGKPEENVHASLTAADHEKMWQAKSILDDNLESPPSVLHLARQIGINEFKLKKGFRQVHGITPYRYLADQRLEKARSLLCERKMNVSEAAYAVGYSSLSHFAKIFRTKFGVTPHEYLAEASGI